MFTVDAAISRVRAFAKAQEWTPSRFAVEAGLSRNSLRGFEQPDWTPNVGTLRALEAIIPPSFAAKPALSAMKPVRRKVAA